MPKISKKISRKLSKLSHKSKKRFNKKGGANNNMTSLTSKMKGLRTTEVNSTFRNLVNSTKKNLRNNKRRKTFSNLVNTAKNNLRNIKRSRNFRKGLNKHVINFSGNKRHSYNRYTRRSKPLNKMPMIDENSDVPLSVLDLDRLAKYLKANPKVTKSLYLKFTRIPRNNPTPDYLREIGARRLNFRDYQNERYERQ
jgi:hypothetical protein